MYVCMYVCMYVIICKCSCMCMYMCIRMCRPKYIRMYVSMYVRMYVCIWLLCEWLGYCACCRLALLATLTASPTTTPWHCCTRSRESCPVPLFCPVVPSAVSCWATCGWRLLFQSSPFWASFCFFFVLAGNYLLLHLYRHRGYHLREKTKHINF